MRIGGTARPDGAKTPMDGCVKNRRDGCKKPPDGTAVKNDGTV